MAFALLRGPMTPGATETMEERLERLVREAIAQQGMDRLRACNLLVDEILRSRRICRAPKGQSLDGIYLELYLQAREQLFHLVFQAIDNSTANSTANNAVSLPSDDSKKRGKARTITFKEWAALRDAAFREILKDENIKKIALEAQGHPPQTRERQRAIAELLEAIRLSGKLCRPHQGKFSPDFYELIYEEAVNRTLTYVCQKIDKYNPSRSQKFMTWVNFRLDKLVIESRREFSPPNLQQLPSLAELENLPQPESPPSLHEAIREYIEKDEEGIFRQKHIRNSPKANFRAIALAICSGKTWEQISADLGIQVPTLSSFFRRSCQKFSSQFQEYLENQIY